jgi:hypothetical protein
MIILFHQSQRKIHYKLFLYLVAYYDLELHQIDVKTAFLNSDLHEEIYMK